MLVLTGRTTSGRNPAGKMIKRLESAAAPIPDLKIQIDGYSLNSSRLSPKLAKVYTLHGFGSLHVHPVLIIDYCLGFGGFSVIVWMSHFPTDRNLLP